MVQNPNLSVTQIDSWTSESKIMRAKCRNPTVRSVVERGPDLPVKEAEIERLDYRINEPRRS